MKKHGRLLASIAVAAVFLSASPASAQQGNPAYNTTLYSDASHTTVVGHIIWVGCDRWGHPRYQLQGTYSQYGVDELVGYCGGDGETEPL